MEQMSPTPSPLLRWVAEAQRHAAEAERLAAERKAAEDERRQAIAQAFANSEIITPLVDAGIILADAETAISPYLREPTGCEVTIRVADHVRLVVTYRPYPNGELRDRFSWLLQHPCQQCGALLYQDYVGVADIYPTEAELGASALELAEFVGRHYTVHHPGYMETREELPL